jgi:hypothetical protein
MKSEIRNHHFMSVQEIVPPWASLHLADSVQELIWHWPVRKEETFYKSPNSFSNFSLSQTCILLSIWSFQQQISNLVNSNSDMIIRNLNSG